MPSRVQLVKSQREIAYHNFVALPLYEDMAPWNIVFQGSRMAYIDYDTKDVTYDNIVSGFVEKKGNLLFCAVWDLTPSTFYHLTPLFSASRDPVLPPPNYFRYLLRTKRCPCFSTTSAPSRTFANVALPATTRTGSHTFQIAWVTRMTLRRTVENTVTRARLPSNVETVRANLITFRA